MGTLTPAYPQETEEKSSTILPSLLLQQRLQRAVLTQFPFSYCSPQHTHTGVWPLPGAKAVGIGTPAGVMPAFEPVGVGGDTSRQNGRVSPSHET